MPEEIRFNRPVAQADNNNILRPLPYHFEVRDYLTTHESELWRWFASAQAKADYTENLRMELLKSTYRLDRTGHGKLHKAAEEVKEALGLDIPLTLYQAQNSPHPNACLFFIPGEGHIVFSGPVLSLLSPQETKSLIGHELAHYELWTRDGGDFHIADRLISAVAHHPQAAGCHEQTARRYQLYTEIFADRGSFCTTQDLSAAICALVKLHTGLADVNAEGYLKQAEEVFAKGSVTSEGLSHPETFIRARALEFWKDQRGDAEGKIREMIEGSLALDELDLIGQQRTSAVTRRFLECFLRPKWFQTDAVLGHAKLFFTDFQPATQGSRALEEFKFNDAKLREYLCYVLLDFTKADPELDDVPLAAALDFSRQLEFDAQFEKIAAKELNMKVRDVRKLKEQAPELLAKAEAQHG
jgi:hypothetical protein